MKKQNAIITGKKPQNNSFGTYFPTAWKEQKKRREIENEDTKLI